MQQKDELQDKLFILSAFPNQPDASFFQQDILSF